MSLLQVLGLSGVGGAAGAPPLSALQPPPPDVSGVGTAPPPPPAAAPPAGTGTPAKKVAGGAGPGVAAQLAEFDTVLASTKTDIDALSTIPVLQATLMKALEVSKTARANVGKLPPASAGAQVTAELTKAKALQTRCADLKTKAPAALTQQKNWAQDPVDALSLQIGGMSAEGKTILTPQLTELRTKLAKLKWQIEKGDFKASETIASEIFFAHAGAKRAADSFAADFPAYKIERDKADKAIEPLRSHGQKNAIAAEIADLEKKLLEADAVASKADLKGWEKATFSVKQIPTLAARVKTLADELSKVRAKAPALKKKFTDEGVDAATADKMATYAQKMLVEEKCTDDEAIKMAKDANGFVKAGLDETDALISARVKKELLAGGTSEDVAQEIGKNLRVAGTSTADDAKAVAQGMKGMSKKVLEELNKNGIQTEACRGPVTDSMAELKGVQPRGWPAGSTWDDVPGVYSGSQKKVVVGTMDDGTGKRKVPGPGEGPVRHGTPDLIGHEGGHAFDAADGTKKSTNAKFLEARTEDITAGNPTGMYGPRDNYFLTTAEGGTNNAGATSETFAESFAMHFKSGATKKWPKLEAFWSANPWGA